MALSLILLSTAALADVPGLINYQGSLTNAYGVAMDTTVSMTFVIYPDSLALDGIWAETQPAVAVNAGIFNVLLGRVNALSADVFNETSRWLGVQVGDDPELGPRQRIVSVGYAFQAAEAETAAYAKNVPAASDGDWNIYGNDLHSAVSGNVAIGSAGLYKLHVEDLSEVPGTYAIYGAKTSSGSAQYLYGVCGQTRSSATTGAGAGVYGLATHSDGGSAGVRGEAHGVEGRGVFAWAADTSGVNYGLYAGTSSPYGYSGYFEGPRSCFMGDVCIGTAFPSAVVDIYGTRSINASTDGIVNIGNSSSFHVTLDNNEIHGRNHNSPSDLWINDFGGDVHIARQGYTYVNMDATTLGSYVRWYNGRLYYHGTSKAYMDDIRELKDDFHKILQAEPRSFIDKETSERNIGYIAEEFEELGLTNLVTYRDGQPDAIKYELVCLYLVELMKDRGGQIEELTRRIEALESR
jgi:hypothetical protein